MSDYLQKEFKEKDVNRLRNLISKKHNDAITTSVGFVKEEIEHKEGDVWEENDKKWTIKNGIKQNVTKLGKLKDLVFLPLFCPECKHQMKHRLDKKFYNIHKMCFECVVKMETKIRTEGKWEEYEQNMIKKNIKSFVDEAKNFIENLSNEATTSYVTEQGDIESWKGGEDKIKEKKQKMLEELNTFEQSLNL